eukprot:scaffold637648_cov17-Prasinocladus_malaysianus.AAC.1
MFAQSLHVGLISTLLSEPDDNLLVCPSCCIVAYAILQTTMSLSTSCNLYKMFYQSTDKQSPGDVMRDM